MHAPGARETLAYVCSVCVGGLCVRVCERDKSGGLVVVRAWGLEEVLESNLPAPPTKRVRVRVHNNQARVPSLIWYSFVCSSLLFRVLQREASRK